MAGYAEEPYAESPYGGAAIVPPLPVAPTNVTATEVTDTSVLISWQGPTLLDFRSRIGGEEIVASVEGNTAQLYDLRPETVYTLDVSAKRIDGVETFSTPITFTTLEGSEVPVEPEEPEYPPVDPENPPVEPPVEPEIPTPVPEPDTPADREARWKKVLAGKKILNIGSSEGIVVANDAINTPDYVFADLWTEKLARRLGCLSLNQHNGGRTRIDVALALLSSYAFNTYPLVIQAAGGNDVGHFWNTEVGRRGFVAATSLILGITRSKSKILAGAAAQTGTWVASENLYNSSTQKSTVPGSTKTFTFTGTGATLAMLGYTDYDGGNLNGSPYTWSLDGGEEVSRSTKSQGLTGTDKTYNSVQPIHFKGLPFGEHTVKIKHTGDAGDPLIVDSLFVWHDDVKDMPFTLMLPPAKATDGGLFLYPSPRPEMSAFDVFRELQEDFFDDFGRDGTFGGIASSIVDGYYPANAYNLRLQDMLHPNKEGHNRIYKAAAEGLFLYNPTSYVAPVDPPTENPNEPNPNPEPTKPIMGSVVVTDTSITWNWSSKAGSAPIDYYKVYIAGIPGFATATFPQYTLSNLANGYTATATVIAVADDELESPVSEPKSGTTTTPATPPPTVPPEPPVENPNPNPPTGPIEPNPELPEPGTEVGGRLFYESFGSGRLRHGQAEIDSYSVDRSATPLIPGDSSGAVGSFSFTGREMPNGESMFMGKNAIALHDSARGIAYGTSDNPSGGNGSVTVTGESLLRKLVVEKTMWPRHDTLENVFKYYLNKCGIPDDKIIVHETIANREVVYKSWQGNVWDHMKMLCTSLNIEIVEDGDKVLLQPPGLNSIDSIENRLSLSWTTSGNNLAQNVSLTAWNTEYTPNGVVFPRPGDDGGILQVSANTIATVWRKLSASPITLNQPVCVEQISSLPYVFGNGEYVIIGKDDLPVKPDWWRDNGGKISVRIVSVLEKDAEVDTIEIKLYGPTSDLYGPYRVAESAGGGADYPALYITAEAILYTEEKISIGTGVGPEDTSTDFASVPTGPFIESTSQGYERLVDMASECSAAQVSLSIASSGYAQLPEAKFATLPGATFYARNSRYRVASCSFSRATFSFTADRFVDVYDLAEVWGEGTTCADFDRTWSEEYSTYDFMIQPLRRI